MLGRAVPARVETRVRRCADDGDLWPRRGDPCPWLHERPVGDRARRQPAVEQDRPRTRVMGEVARVTPADEPPAAVTLIEVLDAAERRREDRRPVLVLRDHLGREGLLVDREHEATRLSRLARRPRLVVEDRHDSAVVRPDVMLEGEVGAGADPEVTAFATEGPEHLARLPVDLVDRPRVAPRDQQMAVARIDRDRVDVEVVPRDRRVVGCRVV